MGNSSVTGKYTFIEQLKVDNRSSSKVIGIYINPNEFPNGGFIVATNKGKNQIKLAIFNYTPVSGKLSSTYSPTSFIQFADYNRKSKEGSIIAIITEEYKLILLNSQNLTPLKTITFNIGIKEGSRISALNFKLSDTLVVGYSDGSIIKARFNEEPINLKHKNIVNMSSYINTEDEFENIKSIFSTDKTNDYDSDIHTPDENAVELLLISQKYKALFAVHRSGIGENKVNLYNLRENSFDKVFCKIEGYIYDASVLDKRDILLLIAFEVGTKVTSLNIYSLHDGQVPITTCNISAMLDYPFTVKTLNVTVLPDKYLGRTSNYGVMDGDIIILGTTKGDIILGKLQLNQNNKICFDLIYIYKLKNSNNSGDMMSNDYEISYVNYDLYFDVLAIGDVSSNVKTFEKILQIGKHSNTEETLPFFSLFYEVDNLGKHQKTNLEINSDLPLFSVTHDILKDRNVILYDQGKELRIVLDEEDETI
jgi:hypothetical protein